MYNINYIEFVSMKSVNHVVRNSNETKSELLRNLFYMVWLAPLQLSLPVKFEIKIFALPMFKRRLAPAACPSWRPRLGHCSALCSNWMKPTCELRYRAQLAPCDIRMSVCQIKSLKVQN